MTHFTRAARSHSHKQAVSARGRLTVIAAACALMALAAPAHAGHYVVSTEAELAAAITAAGADGDPDATIALAANITVVDPFAMPVATKPIAFLQNGFTLSASGVSIYYAGPGITLSFDGTVNGPDSQFKIGTGTVVLTGTGSSFVNSINIDEGELRVQGGGQVTFGNAVDGGLKVNGDDTHVTISGAGSFMDARDGTVDVGSAVGSSLTIADGGQLRTTSTTSFATAAGTQATATVTGAGSLLSSAGSPMTVGLDGSASLTVANGGQVVINGGAGTLNLGTNASGSGTLNIGGAVGSAATAAGTLQASLVQFGAGTNNAVNFNHTDAAYNFAAQIAGNGAVQQTGSGTTVLSGLNTYTGATRVTAGTLRAGGLSTLSSASAYTVGAGGTLDLAGFSHSVASMDVAGTVSTVGTAPGTTLTVNGLWQSTGGTLRLGTRLGADGSVSDRLVLNGGGASTTGTTTLQIVNLGGLGAQTVGDGIEVITAQGGATTTAQTTRDAFALQTGPVIAGAYEYRLFAADAAGNGENWYLRSAGVAPGSVAYRAEVPLFNALPEQLRQSGLTMVGNLHQRMGDERQGASGPRESWARIISTERDIAQGGASAPVSHTRFNGLQVGVDLSNDPSWRAGLYVGQLEGNSSVRGFASGIANQSVGRTDLRSRYLGAYATYRRASDLYADAVLQLGTHNYTLRPGTGAAASADADSWLASLEVGQPFQVGSGWQVEPQAQVVYQHLEVSDAPITNGRAQLDARASWLTRVGVRVKTSMPTGMGTLKPYGRINVYHANGGSDISSFGATAGSTSFATRIGGTSTEASIGATLEVTPRASVYAEVGKLWASGGDSRTSGGLNGSVGLRVRW